MGPLRISYSTAIKDLQTPFKKDCYVTREAGSFIHQQPYSKWKNEGLFNKNPIPNDNKNHYKYLHRENCVK
jgi:hypothetical protein